MTTVIAMDPGKATGVSVMNCDEDTPAHLVDYELVTDLKSVQFWAEQALTPGSVLVCEKFVLSAGNQFTADLTPKEVEGVLKLVLDNQIVWRSRADKVQVPDQILKDHGLWVTGKEVQWEDGRDVNDATKHAIGHIAFTQGHLPTLKEYFRD